MDIRLKDQPLMARTKTVASLERAQGAVAAKKDGYDTYGVDNPLGDDWLVLTRSARKLEKGDELTIDGKRMTIRFVENEANTAREGRWAAFKTPTGKATLAGGAVLGAGASLVAGLSLQASIGGFLFGGAILTGGGLLAAGALVAIAGGFFAGRTKTDEAVTDSAR